MDLDYLIKFQMVTLMEIIKLTIMLKCRSSLHFLKNYRLIDF